MKLLLMFLLSFFSIQAFACRCSPPAPFKTKADLESYDVIALVKIDDLGPKDNTRYNGRSTGDIKVTVIEQFKGERTTTFTDLRFKTSCAMTFNVGEEWLFFGHARDGKVGVGVCDHNVCYRSPDGSRDWGSFSGIKEWTTLREIFGHRSLNLPQKIYYPNGQTEIEQKFRSGKLDGIRKIFYPDGSPYIIERFKNGQRVGYRHVYSESGQLTLSVTYKNGMIANTIAYHDTAYVTGYYQQRIAVADDPFLHDDVGDSKFYKHLADSVKRSKKWGSQIAWNIVYGNYGRNYKADHFSEEGKLIATTRHDRANEIEETYRYYRNGKVEVYLRYDKTADKQIEYDYAKDGTRKVFINKCGICDIIFDKVKPVAATADPIYIQ